MAVKGKTFEGPLDPVEDFNNPTTVPGSPADAEVGHDEELEAEAQEFAETVATPADERTPTQQELPGTETVPDAPQVIRNKQMLVKFVEAIMARDTDDNALLKMKFSFMLTPEHEAYLPSEVVEAWNIVKQGHCKRYDIIEVPPQTIEVNLVPDDEGAPPDLKILSATIEKPSLQFIEESGSGKNKSGIRFSFLAIMDRDVAPTEFAIKFDGDDVWLAMGSTQGRLAT